MQITTQVVLADPVAAGASFNAPFPSGYTYGTTLELSGHELVSVPGGNEYAAIDVRAGATQLAVTNNTGAAIPAGSYILGVNIRGESVSAIDPTVEPNPSYVFARADNAVASSTTITQTIQGVSYEQTISYNAGGEVLSITKWTRVGA